MKKIAVIFVLAVIMFACKSEAPKEEVQVVETKPEVISITFDEFKTNPENYVDKLVKVDGTCIHTCKHGGKKMHIVGEDPDFSIKVTASETVAMFDKALEGSRLSVEGIVKAQIVNEDYLNNWEAELKKDIETQEETGGEVNEEHHESLGQIENMRKELKESGKEQISYYSIECKSFEEKTAVAEEKKEDAQE